MDALYQIVRSGKALYVGISNYPADRAAEAHRILQEKGIHLLIHQPRYNMIDRWSEEALLDTLQEKGMGCIAFSPLAQGILTNRYLEGIPEDSRVATDGRYLKEDRINLNIQKVKALKEIADQRGQSIAQMAVAWLLKDNKVTSVLIGASKAAQILENVATLKNIEFSQEELERIDQATMD
jgi:L-glyceraldehyde 3-phosphate reductase